MAHGLRKAALMMQLKMGARAVATALGVIALMFALVVPLAHAGEPVRVEVNSTRAVKSDANGKEHLEGEQAQISVDDVVRVTIGFTALEASTIRQGDTITVNIPPEFEAYAQQDFDLHFHAYEGEPVGRCTPTAQAITCTFNDDLEQRARLAEDRAPGELWFLVKAKESSKNTEFDFAVNSVPALVQIPLGIAGQLRAYEPQVFDKVSTPIEDSHTEIPWSLRFHGEDIANKLGVTFDGVTPQTIEFEDKLGDAFQEFPVGEQHERILRNWALVESISATSTESRALAKPGNSLADGFEMQVEFTPEGSARIRLTGPFRPDANYLVGLRTPLRSEFRGHACGREYHNSISLLGGSGETVMGSVHCGERANGKITLAPGFGGIHVVKQFQNPENVAADRFINADYVIKVKYTFPNGARAGDFRVNGGEYIAPGTLNNEHTGGEAEIALKSVGGGELKGELEGQLPKGTSVVLTELLPRVEGMVWKVPEFHPSNTFTIQDLTSTEVILKNTIEKVTSEKAPVKILKKISGASVNAPTGFDFLVQCEGEADRQVRVEVNKETGIGNIEVGKECTVTEQDSTPPTGYVLQKPEPQKFIIPNNGHTFTFVNTYVQDHGPSGTFTLVKRVEAEPGILVPKTFDFSYRCEKEGTTDVFADKLKDVVPNTPRESAKIPEGFTCTITELNADIPDAILETQNPGKVRIGEQITITNVYSQIIPQAGTFTLKKVVQAEPNIKVPQEFQFDYRCAKPGSPDITGTIEHVKAGTTAVSGEVPEGYTCSVSEQEAKVDGLDWNVAVSGPVSAGQVVTVTNSYSRSDTPPVSSSSNLPWWLLGIPLLGGLASGSAPQESVAAPSGTAVPSDQGVEKPVQHAETVRKPSALANTGASVFGVVALAVIAVVIGIFLVRRKKK